MGAITLFFGHYGGDPAAPPAQAVITIDFQTTLTSGPEAGDVDGTRKVIATLTPGDASVVYVFDETEVS